MFKSVEVAKKDWKAGPDDGLLDGQFRAVVSVFGNVDSYGDVIRPGAFANTLAEWTKSGDTIPIYWSHQLADPDMNIGWVESAEETDRGLEVLAQLDLTGPASSKAQQVYHLLKRRRVKEFSFSYDVLDGSTVEEDGKSFNELRELKLYEVGPTPVGANPATELLAIKHLPVLAVKPLPLGAFLPIEAKAGRVISAKNEATLRSVLDGLAASAAQLTSVLASLDPEPGKAITPDTAHVDDGPVTDEEPSQAKSQEPHNRHASTTSWATRIHLTELENMP